MCIDKRNDGEPAGSGTIRRSPGLFGAGLDILHAYRQIAEHDIRAAIAYGAEVARERVPVPHAAAE